MNCRKQYYWCSLRGKLDGVAVYSLVRSRFCRNQHPAADYCGNLLGSRGIGAGSSPIGCEGLVKASKVQDSSLLHSHADNFVGYSNDKWIMKWSILFLRHSRFAPKWRKRVSQTLGSTLGLVVRMQLVTLAKGWRETEMPGLQHIRTY